MAIELNPQQKYVLYRLWKGVTDENKEEQSLGGFAGTGKSTLIRYLFKMLGNFGCVAYTGKAANVLRRKGVPATTIHSRIYKPHFEGGHIHFELVPNLDVDGLIIDEASMVPKDIYEDLKSFGVPLIFVGDHGQLEPIGSDFNLMGNPEYKLEEIHRNAGDIARFAQHLRLGFGAQSFQPTDGTVRLIAKETMQDTLSVNQIICAFNKTRVQTNNTVRQALNYGGVINVGERIMCLKNNRNMRLFNGMQGIVKSLYDGKRGAKYMDFEFDNMIYENIKYDVKQFGKESNDSKTTFGQDGPNPFDYAYCITCHKSQGDEWDKVMVFEQRSSRWNHRRWAYTAASRARDSLIWRLGY